MTTQEAVQKWNELGIDHADFEFNCGGDSMNDTTLNFYDKKGKVILKDTDTLNDYFDNQVYKNVTFYEASDGHYQGEFGVVTIELDDSSDDVEEHDFTYSKDSQAEYTENFTEVLQIKLTDEQVVFIEKNVSNMNGGMDERTIINYKRDFIMTDDDERIENDIKELVDNEADSCEFENAQGEATDWYRYTTNGDTDDEEELTIDNGYLKLSVTREFTVYQDSNW
jgi:hypothetical protein